MKKLYNLFIISLFISISAFSQNVNIYTSINGFSGSKKVFAQLQIKLMKHFQGSCGFGVFDGGIDGFIPN